MMLRGFEWRDRPVHWVTPTFQCAGCFLWFELEAFPPNPRVRSGRSSWCRGCHVARNRRWRAEHPEYVAAYNAARREAYRAAHPPKATVCSECGVELLDGRPDRVICGARKCRDARYRRLHPVEWAAKQARKRERRKARRA